MNKMSSEDVSFDHVKTAKISTKLKGTDTGSSFNDHRSRANYNNTAGEMTKIPDDLSNCNSSQTSNMGEKGEQNSSVTSTDSGYQSESPGIPCIGHRVGLGSFDLLGELAKVEPNLVRDIVKKASPTTEDLINVSEVSPTWQSFLSPKEEADVDRHREKQAQETITHKENLPKEKSSKRCITESESPLTEVQEIGKPQFTSTPLAVTEKEDPASHADGLYQKFHDISQTLFTDESLTKCARHGCQAPAKHLMNKQKGQCTSFHCGFEFCTNCRCEFHGGQPCKVFEKKRTTKEGGIGSRKSKRNLQRIGKL